MSVIVGKTAEALDFPDAAKVALENAQLRRNVHHATNVIRGKRALRVEEMPDWEALRQAGSNIKAHTLAHLDVYLVEFERNCERAGGKVHWARDAEEANRIAIELVQRYGGEQEQIEVIKVKTMTSDEVQLNHALNEAGITPIETDLADMIVQLGNDEPSHIVVPALHKNRFEIRDIFRESMQKPELTEQPEELTAAARSYLRDRFLRVKIGISGANFAIAETGSVCVVESEGNGRMCVTLPDVLITLVGIEKLIPSFADLEVFLQTLPRSATGERMNPYNSLWTGVTPGDGPQAFHVILLDNGRTNLLKDELERETLQCIRCGACLNACPVYRETGGHAYGSIYSGPIGCDPFSAVAIDETLTLAAVCVYPLRRLLRSLPREDQTYPRYWFICGARSYAKIKRRSAASSQRRTSPCRRQLRSFRASAVMRRHSGLPGWAKAYSNVAINSSICPVWQVPGRGRAICVPSQRLAFADWWKQRADGEQKDGAA